MINNKRYIGYPPGVSNTVIFFTDYFFFQGKQDHKGGHSNKTFGYCVNRVIASEIRTQHTFTRIVIFLI